MKSKAKLTLPATAIGEIAAKIGPFEGRARQPDLLAFKATGAAARANEQGKGLAVVASEARLGGGP